MLASSESRPIARNRLPLPAEDFRRLGLMPSEARVDVIRQAAGLRGASLREEAKGDRSAIARWAELATSTYRVLDPRQRARLVERVQLCQAEPVAFRRPQIWWLRKHEAPPIGSTTSDPIEALLPARRRRRNGLLGAAGLVLFSMIGWFVWAIAT
jgi:hypothetical protein